MSETKKYLKQVSEMRKRMMNRPKEFVYSGAEEFVLKEGRPFKADLKKLNRFGTGQMKQCYKNAFDLTMENSDLIYVEGFATTVIPVMHAWVVDQDGVIADPTWKVEERLKDYEPSGYYGVMFSHQQCIDIMFKSGQYGMLDAWTAGWPLFQKKFKSEVKLCPGKTRARAKG